MKYAFVLGVEEIIKLKDGEMIKSPFVEYFEDEETANKFRKAYKILVDLSILDNLQVFMLTREIYETIK